MKQYIITAFFMCATAMSCSCAAPERSEVVLRRAGFSNIEITGWSPWSCSEDDTYSTGFVAKNALGSYVEGTVCCGLLTKACTIRF